MMKKESCKHENLEYLGWGMFAGTDEVPPMPVAYHYKCKDCGGEFITGELRHEIDWESYNKSIAECVD